MWMRRINCNNTVKEVRDQSKEHLTDLLKKKVICETETLLHALQNGYRLDPQFIISEIKLIDMLSQDLLDANFSTYALQYYLNNLWETS